MRCVAIFSWNNLCLLNVLLNIPPAALLTSHKISMCLIGSFIAKVHHGGSHICSRGKLDVCSAQLVTRGEIIPHLPTRAIPDLPLPLFDSVPQKSLPSPSIPFAPSPRLAETPSCTTSEHPPPPPIPPLHAPEAPAGCDSFPRRQEIPSLLRL
jgi:hypothetical protein